MASSKPDGHLQIDRVFQESVTVLITSGESSGVSWVLLIAEDASRQPRRSRRRAHIGEGREEQQKLNSRTRAMHEGLTMMVRCRSCPYLTREARRQ